MPINAEKIIILSQVKQEATPAKLVTTWDSLRSQNVTITKTIVREDLDRHKIQELNEINTIKTSKYLEDLTNKGD